MDWLRAKARLLTDAVKAFLADRGAHMAAAVAYYALFSVFPLLAMISLVVGAIFPATGEGDGLEQQVLDQAAAFLLLPPDVLNDTVRALRSGGSGLGLLAPLGFLWAATGVFSALRTSLNLALGRDVTTEPGFVRQKITDLFMVLIAGLLLVLSVAIASALYLVQAWAERVDAAGGAVQSIPWELIAWGASVPVNILAFAALYRFVNAAQPRTAALWFGASVAGIGFEIAKTLFLTFMQTFGGFSVYGAVGWVFALLTWTYVSAAIAILGVELVVHYPSRPEPARAGEASDGRAAA